MTFNAAQNYKKYNLYADRTFCKHIMENEAVLDKTHIYLNMRIINSTNYENEVQNVNFTTCPKAFHSMSVAPISTILTLHRQRERTTTRRQIKIHSLTI